MRGACNTIGGAEHNKKSTSCYSEKKTTQKRPTFKSEDGMADGVYCEGVTGGMRQETRLCVDPRFAGSNPAEVDGFFKT